MTIVAGDFNAHHPLWDSPNDPDRPLNEAGRILFSLIDSGLLFLHAPKDLPTYATHRGTTACLDLLLTTRKGQNAVLSCNLDPELVTGSDHQPVLTKLSVNSGPFMSTPLRRDWRKVDWAQARTLFEQATSFFAPRVSTTICPETLVTILYKGLRAFDHLVPRITPVSYRQKWWTDELSTLRKELCLSRNIWLRTRSLEDHEIFKSRRNVFNTTLKRIKRRHWNDYLQSMTGSNIWDLGKFSALWIIGTKTNPNLSSWMARNSNQMWKEPQLLKRTCFLMPLQDNRIPLLLLESTTQEIPWFQKKNYGTRYKR
jgi:hypothetical protein